MRKFSLILLAFIFLASAVDIHGLDKVELHKINPSLWVHTSYFNYNGVLNPSNGLIADTRNGLILIDTPWTDDQTQSLIRITRQTFEKDIILAIFTHAHQDRIGGINVLLARHIETMCTADTAVCIRSAGLPSPQTIFRENPKTLSIGGVVAEIFYPGPAHTQDNITVYFPQFKTLFGGCIVKALNFTNLGNVSDGDPKMYAATVQTLLTRYPDVKTVIPGHGDWGDVQLLRHTVELAQTAN